MNAQFQGTDSLQQEHNTQENSNRKPRDNRVQKSIKPSEYTEYSCYEGPCEIRPFIGSIDQRRCYDPQNSGKHNPHAEDHRNRHIRRNLTGKNKNPQN